MRASSWKVLAVAALMLAAVSSEAQAGTISVSPGTQVLSGNQTSQAEINAVLAAYFLSIGADVGLLYKSDDEDDGDEEGVDSGAAAGWYTTTFSPPDDAEDATLSWDGGAFITSNPIYLLVKDGSATPAWYLFSITGWDGKDTIQLDNFWAGAGKTGKGAISHVSIYGGAASVPDGGSMTMLLGIALLGLAGARRMLP